jgi:DNA repair protein Swi5/Sae3
MASEERAAPPTNDLASDKRTLPVKDGEDVPTPNSDLSANSIDATQAPVGHDAQPTNNPTPASTNSRLQALSTKNAQLESTLSELQSQKDHLVSECILPSGFAMPSSWTDEAKAASALATANTVIKDHISLLQKYNEIKDIAQGLMGLIAETRGVRLKVVMEEYGMDEGD